MNLLWKDSYLDQDLRTALDMLVKSLHLSQRGKLDNLLIEDQYILDIHQNTFNK
jgi:hypothetical protein